MVGRAVGPTQSPEKTLTERRPSSLRDRIDLRVQMQDAVHEFSRLRRDELWHELTRDHPDWPQDRIEAEIDKLQPSYDEYDPVVQMAVVAADHRNPVEVRLRAAGEAAQYVRPKLKSVEVRVGDDDPEVAQRKQELLGRLREYLDAGAGAKRATVIDGTVRPSPPQSGSAEDQELQAPEED